MSAITSNVSRRFGLARMRTSIMLPAVGVAVALVALAAASASDADMIYWGDQGADKISFANLPTGGGDGVVATGSATVSSPNGLSIDAAANEIYWANAATNSISRASLDGSGGSNLTIADPTLVDVPTAIAVDPPAGKLFWTNAQGGPAGTGSIAEANLDGTEPQDIATGTATVNDPQGIAIDPADNKIFWANAGTNTISFADLSNTGFGGNLTISGTASPVNNPVGLAVDPATRTIYWADAVNPGHISSASLETGSGSSDIRTLGASPLNVPAGVAIDPVANRIYWADKHGGTISVANLAGGAFAGDLPTTGASALIPYFVALLEAPLAAGVPQVTGGSTAGSTLTCSPGAWAPDLLGGFLYRAPHTYAYEWTLNGAPIAGANSSAYTTSSAGAYACQVTATNHAGSASQTSAASNVSGTGMPTQGTSPPALTRVGQSHPRWREGTKLAVIASAGPPVGTTFRFTVNESVGVRLVFDQRRHGHNVSRGTLSFSAAPGRHSVRFQGRLSKRQKLPTGRYTVLVIVTGVTGKTVTATLKFTIVKR